MKEHEISGGRGTVKIQLTPETVDELPGYAVTVKKILSLLFEKINRQIWNGVTLTRDYIDFEPRELYDRGIYHTPNAASKGLTKAAELLTAIKLDGEYRYNRKTTIKYSGTYRAEKIFTKIERSWGNCRVYVNGRTDWRFLFQAYSFLPVYYYGLPGRTSELLYLLCSTARQRTAEIKSRGYFTVNMRTVQEALHLPEQTTHPKRDVTDEIKKAAGELSGSDFLISITAEPSWHLKKTLTEGFLTVALSKALAEPFIAFETKKRRALA